MCYFTWTTNSDAFIEYLCLSCSILVEIAGGMLKLICLLVTLHQYQALVASSDLLEKYLNSDYIADSLILNKKCLSANGGKGSHSEDCKQVDYFLKLQKAQVELNREIQITTKPKQFQVESLPDQLAYSNVFEDYIVAKR